MRGDHQLIAGLPQAVAVLDMALSGVRCELGDIPFDWMTVPSAKPASASVVVPVAVVTEAPAEVVRPAAAPLTSESAAASLMAPREPVRAMPVATEIPAEVWSDGDVGGVLLVVQGPMPDARCVALATAMLAAVNLRDVAVSWVGYSGKVDRNVLMDAMKAKAPTQVLVLGQAPLGALLGRNLGVEGWHASSNKVVEGWDGAVGVTYPLELLMKQPLFKRLAWHHLLAWGDGTGLIANGNG